MEETTAPSLERIVALPPFSPPLLGIGPLGTHDSPPRHEAVSLCLGESWSSERSEGARAKDYGGSGGASCNCWAGYLVQGLRGEGFGWIECSVDVGAKEVEATPSEAPSGAPSAEGAKELPMFPARFGILALRRHGLVLLAPGISARSRKLVREVERAGGGGEAARESAVEEVVRALREKFGAERVTDLRHLGPLHIPSGYEDDFNFAKHTLARIAARCIDRAALERVLAAAAHAHRTFREAVEESYRPGDLRRCRAIDLDQHTVFRFGVTCLDHHELSSLF